MDTYLSRVPAMSAPEAEPSLRPRVLPPPSSDIKGHNWAEEDSDGENECGEFLYGVQGTCCADLYRHPQLDADIEAVKEIYGENAVSVREYGTIDDADIDLHINISFLDEEVATAWKVIRTEPIVLRLRFSLSQYLDGPEPTIDVFQPSNRDDFGLGIQLKKSPSFPGVQDSAVRSSLTGSDLRSGLAGTDLRGPRLMNRSVSCTLRNPKSELYGSHTTTQVSGHCKTVPTLEYGFLVQIMKYAEQRLPTLNEYCVVCDEQHVFQNASMLKVVGLLVAMCRAALESPRKSIIFEPYPSVVDPNDPKTLAFNPKGSYLEIKKQMDRLDPLAHPLLQWIISSNRSHIVKLPLSRVKINKRKLMQPSHLKNSKLQNNKCLLLVLNTALRIVGGVMQIVALYPYVQQIENSQLNGECFIQLSYSFRLHSSPYY
ncbi:hypothetical protein AB205_0158870 [Aquarana catesbeiana]|uniref:Uncharacterized protein n=1 Tax=Aquarana catesbeiana TaxID=8400 RepID=A0A2G9SA50_AQUCT|nr:hypothetical protein AB205_0158870 [Aquarana catesbeiana]